MNKNIKLSELEVNKGQIEGLPKNPRFIKDHRFKQLVKSIEDDPEMLALRELIVYPYKNKFVIICGNMRYRAMIELGYKEAPCKVLPPEVTVDKLRAYTIKDNVPYGEDDWDSLANEWDADELKEWGMDVPKEYNPENKEKEIENLETGNECPKCGYKW
jgi:ParB-like chromosome segregation protein Spo0J